MNGDGIPDIVTPDPAVLMGKGDGAFEAAVSYPSSNRWTNVQLADLRGDGRLDMVGSVTFDDASSVVLLNAGGGKFQDGTALSLSVGFDSSSCLAVSDFNRDGHDDAAVGIAGGIEVLAGTGNAKDPFRLSELISLVSRYGFCPIAGDFNNDGIPDLLVSEDSNDLAFLAGSGNGTFSTPVVTVLDAEFGFEATGDFNGDGNLDLAGFSDGLVLLFGNGAGGFGAPVLISSPNIVNAVTAADLNGDGLTDLVLVGPNQLTVELSTGGGSFQSKVYMLPQQTEIYSSVVVDVNNDGIPDIVVVGESAVATFLGQGGGVFAPTFELNASGYDAVVADLNGDGMPDLALGDGVEVKVFLGNGKGAFASPRNPDGLWFAIPGGGNTLAAAYLQSQSASSGFADLLNLGVDVGPDYLGVLFNEKVAAQ